MIAYDRDGITVICADNAAVDWPQCDLGLTDPPYSETTHKGARTGTGEHVGAKMDMGFEHITTDELDAIFTRLSAVAQRWVVSFLDWRHVARLDVAPPEGLRFVRHAIWIKPNGAPQFTGDRPATGWESIAVLHKDGVKLRWNGGGKHGVYTHNKPHQTHRISDHPNAKPIPLLIELINDFSDKGDLVFDPFGGSGAVAVACKLTGRRCVTIERSEKHVANLVHFLEYGNIRQVLDAAPDSQMEMFPDE